MKQLIDASEMTSSLPLAIGALILVGLALGGLYLYGRLKGARRDNDDITRP